MERERLCKHFEGLFLLINKRRPDESEDGRWDETLASEGEKMLTAVLTSPLLEFKTRCHNLSQLYLQCSSKGNSCTGGAL